MTTRRIPSRFAQMSSVARLVGVVALIGVASCATRQQVVAEKEDNLAAAGFLVRPANTQARIDMLSTLPPDHFVQRVHGDDVSYVYADPLVCHCLYVGTQLAYDRYRSFVQAKQLADEQQLTAQLYTNNNWDWNAWGGGFGPGYGFGF